jgi:hypothetical protein
LTGCAKHNTLFLFKFKVLGKIQCWIERNYIVSPQAGHSTRFQVGGDNPKVVGGILQNKAVFYFHFDIFIFENKVAGEKMQLDRQFARCPAAVDLRVLSFLLHIFFSNYTFINNIPTQSEKTKCILY